MKRSSLTDGDGTLIAPHAAAQARSKALTDILLKNPPPGSVFWRQRLRGNAEMHISTGQDDSSSNAPLPQHTPHSRLSNDSFRVSDRPQDVEMVPLTRPPDGYSTHPSRAAVQPLPHPAMMMSSTNTLLASFSSTRIYTPPGAPPNPPQTSSAANQSNITASSGAQKPSFTVLPSLFRRRGMSMASAVGEIGCCEGCGCARCCWCCWYGYRMAEVLLSCCGCAG